jgi:hypothetical protein
MSLEDLGNIGEFVAAIGVIISLIYLGVQIRQNTRSVRTASYQSWFDSYSNFSNTVLASPELDALVHRGATDPDSLTPEERRHFNGISRRGFRLWENLYYHRLQGTIDADLYSTWRDNFSRRYAQPTGVKLFWVEEQGEFSEVFREEIKKCFEAQKGTD